MFYGIVIVYTKELRLSLRTLLVGVSTRFREGPWGPEIYPEIPIPLNSGI